MSVRKLILLVLVSAPLYGYSGGGNPGPKISTEEYIRTYVVLSVEEMMCSGIPASVKLAQAIVESGSGNTTLARKANNHFGIKCRETWYDSSHYQKDDEYVNGKLVESCFRAYPTADACYRDHTDFLVTRKYYISLFSIPQHDYKRWCKGLEEAGYASAGGYAKSLIAVIERYQLHRYDRMQVGDLLALKQELQQQNVPAAGMAMPEIKPQLPPDPFAGPEVPVLQMDTLLHIYFLPVEEGQINGIPVLKTQRGDTPEKIALQRNLDPILIRQYNDLGPGEEITPGCYLFMGPKKKKIPRHEGFFHVVRPGETLWEVSQQYGIWQENLRKNNGLVNDQEVAGGEKVWINEKTPQAPKSMTPAEKMGEREAFVRQLYGQ